MVAVPEFINPEPENVSPKGAEATNLQQDTNFDSVNLGDLDATFSGQDNAASVFGDLAISSGDDAGNAFSDINNMTSEELDVATKEQQAVVAGIENQIAQVTNSAQAAEVQSRAKQLADADAYFANV